MPMQTHLLQIGGLAVCLAAWPGLLPTQAFADGGTVQLAQVIRGYRITVFTSPTPLRVGEADFSVLVQDAQSGAPLSDARVSFHLGPSAQAKGIIHAVASYAAATNKLLQAASVSLPAAGRWNAIVDIDGPYGSAHTQFPVEISGPLPRWRALWPWFSWPLAVVGLFGMRQWLTHRRSH
jgi:hypothetical protein